MDMFRPRRGFCPQLAWLILKASLYTSWILGLFPFIYDGRRKQMRRSHRLLLYGFILNIVSVLLFVFNGVKFKTSRKLEAFQRNTVLELINWLVSLLSLVSAVVIHLMNFLGSKKVLKVINEMWSLHQEHFRSYNVLQNCHQFSHIVVQKGFTILAQTGNLLIVHFGMPENESPPYLILFVSLTQIAINLTVMHCFLAILLVYGYLWKINDQLRKMFNHFNGNSSTDSSRIRNLLSQYSRLLELSKSIRSVYELQMALILAGGLAGNIVVIFFMIVYGISLGNSSIFLVIFPQTLIVNIWDFWLSIVVCEITEREGKETSIILKQFNDIEHPDPDIERIVNEFSWLCVAGKFRYQLLGLFTINYNMGFHMIITSFLYLLYLVQFDFMNL
ncbi:hypothetical protein KR067_012229 [Drosophila pandora]|nr:hypothetical protein KR067_012229 [Drosophila pandora]